MGEKMTQENNKKDEEISSETSSEIDENKNNLMPDESKNALITLMKSGVIFLKQKKEVFESICRHEQHIRRHLSEVNIKLTLDKSNGLAFISGRSFKDDDGEELKTIAKKTILSVYDTLLILVLRKYYQEKEIAGDDKIIIDSDKLTSLLSPFLDLTNSTKSDNKRLSGAISKLTSKKILSVAGSADRFEITRVIKYAIDLTFLESILKEYQSLVEEKIKQKGELNG